MCLKKIKMAFIVADEYKKFYVNVKLLGRNVQNRNTQRQHMKTLINGLSQVAFDNQYKNVVGMIQTSKERCATFQTTETQVKDIIMWIPRMKDHEDILVKEIRNRRKKYRLEV
jgi:hypothetical protein